MNLHFSGEIRNCLYLFTPWALKMRAKAKFAGLKAVRVVRVPLKYTQNLVILRQLLTSKKCAVSYNSCAQSLLCLLSVLFGDGLVTVVVVVC